MNKEKTAQPVPSQGADSNTAKKIRTILGDNANYFTRVLAVWNTGLSSRSTIKESEHVSLAADFKNYNISSSLEDWELVVSIIDSNDYLSGRKEKKPIPVKLKWVLRPDNFNKILSGGYDENTTAISDRRHGHAADPFKSLLGPLIDKFGERKLSDYAISLLQERIGNYHPDSISKAVDQVLMKYQFMPTLEEVVNIAAKHQEKYTPTGGEIKCHRCSDHGVYARKIKPEHRQPNKMADYAFRCECEAGKAVSSEIQPWNPKHSKCFT